MSIKNFNLSVMSIHCTPVNLVAKKELLVFQLNYFWQKHCFVFGPEFNYCTPQHKFEHSIIDDIAQFWCFEPLLFKTRVSITPVNSIYYFRKKSTFQHIKMHFGHFVK